MDREDRIRKLRGGTDTAIWAATEIERMEASLIAIKSLAQTRPMDLAILRRVKEGLSPAEDSFKLKEDFEKEFPSEARYRHMRWTGYQYEIVLPRVEGADEHVRMLNLLLHGFRKGRENAKEPG